MIFYYNSRPTKQDLFQSILQFKPTVKLNQRGRHLDFFLFLSLSLSTIHIHIISIYLFLTAIFLFWFITIIYLSSYYQPRFPNHFLSYHIYFLSFLMLIILINPFQR